MSSVTITEAIIAFTLLAWAMRQYGEVVVRGLLVFVLVPVRLVQNRTWNGTWAITPPGPWARELPSVGVDDE